MTNHLKYLSMTIYYIVKVYICLSENRKKKKKIRNLHLSVELWSSDSSLTTIRCFHRKTMRLHKNKKKRIDYYITNRRRLQYTNIIMS